MVKLQAAGSSRISKVQLKLLLSSSLVLAFVGLSLNHGWLSGGATVLVSEEEGASEEGDSGGKGGKKWGHWRTPGNLNAYQGMKHPVENTNPLGDHVISRDLDRDVNISEVEARTNYNPLWDVITGKGLPKMFYEDDRFTACTDPEKCKIVRVKHATSQFHTDVTKRSARDNQRDLFVKCSDPTSPYYHPSCDPNRAKYGRPLRPGGFPDDDTVVQSRIHQERMRNLTYYNYYYPDMGYVKYDRRHYAKYYYIDPREPQIPAMGGVLKVPVTGTGHYGGLTGPPFLTEGPPGGENGGYSYVRPNMTAWHIRGLTPEEWEAMGFGDRPVNAQAIVGQDIRDSVYRYRYKNIDQEKFQPELGDEEGDAGNSSDTNSTGGNSTDSAGGNGTAAAVDPFAMQAYLSSRGHAALGQRDQHRLHILSKATSLPRYRDQWRISGDRHSRYLRAPRKRRASRDLDGEKDRRVPDNQAKYEAPITTVANDVNHEIDEVFYPVEKKNRRTQAELRKTKINLRDAANLVQAMEQKMNRWKQRVSLGLPAKFPSIFSKVDNKVKMEDGKKDDQLLRSDFNNAGLAMERRRKQSSLWNLFNVFDDDTRTSTHGGTNLMNPAVGPGEGGY